MNTTQGPYSHHLIFFILMNGPSKLEGLSLTSLSALLQSNDPAYWAHS